MILWGNPWGFESLRSHRGSRQLPQQQIDHRLLVLEEAFVPVHEQRRRTPFGVRRMTDVLGSDPELDAERLRVRLARELAALRAGFATVADRTRSRRQRRNSSD